MANTTRPRRTAPIGRGEAAVNKPPRPEAAKAAVPAEPNWRVVFDGPGPSEGALLALARLLLALAEDEKKDQGETGASAYLAGPPRPPDPGG
jgi:hypothetical protein